METIQDLVKDMPLLTKEAQDKLQVFNNSLELQVSPIRNLNHEAKNPVYDGNSTTPVDYKTGTYFEYYIRSELNDINTGTSNIGKWCWAHKENAESMKTFYKNTERDPDLRNRILKAIENETSYI